MSEKDDLQVIAKMLTDGLATDCEYQRLVDIEDSGERVATTREFLYRKQKMISARLDDLDGLSDPWIEVVTYQYQSDDDDVIDENDVMKTPVFLLTPVLNCLFQYLAVRDLKRCKSVCRKWREVAEVKLRKREKATIVFSETISLLRYVAHYATCLKPFTSFSFLYCDKYNIEDLEIFFSTFGKAIKQLAIDPPGFRSSSFKFDFCPFLRPSIITKLKLTGPVAKQELYPSLAKFSSLKYLYATNYILNIEGVEKKLSLLELTLEWVSIHHGSQIVSQLLINEVFDLRNAENIILRSYEEEEEASFTQLSMDMSIEILNPKKIHFKDVVCFNWTRCSWQIGEFYLYGGHFTEPNQATIKKMHFVVDQSARIDLALLSDCIEEFVLEYSNSSEVLCSYPITLPHLKTMRLIIREDATPCTADIFQNVIQHFMLCENLLKLDLRSVGFSTTCNVTVPPSVREMHVSFITSLNANLNLQRLSISNYTIEDVENYILPWVNAKELILFLKNVVSPQEFDRVFDLILAKYDKVSLILPSGIDFLSKHGDFYGKYFAFENQKMV